MPSSSSSSSAADSYIGSVISLTSKFEIRYEGVLCSLNPHDSTLGLKNVRSFGTEGRKKDGEIPPSDKVYEYILFRGSDIKDLQVNSSPPPPVEESVHGDPAIIESKFATGNPVSSKPVALNSGAVVESSPYEQESLVKPNSFSSLQQQHGYGPQAGSWDSTTAPMGDYSSNSISADWMRHDVSASHDSFAGQRAMISNATQLSPITSFPVASNANSQTNFSNSLAPMPPLASLNPPNPYFMSPVTPGQFLTHPQNAKSVPVAASLPNYPPNISGYQSNTDAFPSAGLNSEKFEAVNFNAPYPAVVQPSHALSYAGSSMVDSMTGDYLKHSSSLITPDQSLQTRQSEFPPVPTVFPYDRKMATVNSTTAFSSSPMPTMAPAAPQAPLPQFHPPTQQFTEEFDFEAMNQKFNKDEVWGQLGSKKLHDKGERTDDNDAGSQLKVNGDGADSKAAYKKDDFFDTISCHSSTSHRGRGRQNHYTERPRFDSRNYEDFQQRPRPQFGDYGGGRGPYNQRGAYGGGWGRGGYNSGGRGRGGNVQW